MADLILIQFIQFIKDNLELIPYSKGQLMQWLLEMDEPWSGDIIYSKTINILDTFIGTNWQRLLRYIRTLDKQENLADRVEGYLNQLLANLDSVYLCSRKNADKEHKRGIAFGCAQQLKQLSEIDPKNFNERFKVLRSLLKIIQYKAEHYQTVAGYESYPLHHPMLYEPLRHFSGKKPKDKDHYFETHAIDLKRSHISFAVTTQAGQKAEWSQSLGSSERIGVVIERLGGELHPDLVLFYEQFHNQKTPPSEGISFTDAFTAFSLFIQNQFGITSISKYYRTTLDVVDKNYLQVTQEFEVYQVTNMLEDILDDAHPDKMIFAVNDIPLFNLKLVNCISIQESAARSSFSYYFQDNTKGRLFENIIQQFFPIMLDERTEEQLFDAAINEDNIAKSALFSKAIYAVLTGDVTFIRKYVSRSFLVSNPGCIYPQGFSGKKLTLIHFACLSGEVDILIELMQLSDASFATKDSENNTPLHYAAKCGHYKLIAHAYEVCGYREFNVSNNAGDTPLHLAAYNGHRKIVEYFLDHVDLKFNVHQENRSEQTPIYLAVLNGYDDLFEVLNVNPGMPDDCFRQLLTIAIIKNKVDLASALLRKYVLEENLVLTSTNATALHLAAQVGSEEIIVAIFEIFKAARRELIMSKDIDDNTPFHCACAEGGLLAAKLLLKKMVINIEDTNAIGNTPLFLAMYHKHNDLAIWLITECHANLNHVNSLNESFVQVAMKCSVEVLRCAVNLGGVDINATFEDKFNKRTGLTLLHIIVKAGVVERIEYCLSLGVNRFAVDDGGLMPVHYAIEQDNAVELLDALHSQDQSLCDIVPYTQVEPPLLHHAAAYGDFNAFNWLVAHGMDPFARNAAGKTSIEVAKDKKQFIFLENVLLIKAAYSNGNFSLGLNSKPKYGVLKCYDVRVEGRRRLASLDRGSTFRSEIRHTPIHSSDEEYYVAVSFAGFPLLRGQAGFKYIPLNTQVERVMTAIIAGNTPARLLNQNQVLAELQDGFYIGDTFTDLSGNQVWVSSSEVNVTAVYSRLMLTQYTPWALKNIIYHNNQELTVDKVDIVYSMDITAISTTSSFRGLLPGIEYVPSKDSPLCHVILTYSIDSGVSLTNMSPVLVTPTIKVADYTEQQYFIASLECKKALTQYEEAKKDQVSFDRAYGELTREILLRKIEFLDSLNLQNIFRIHESKVLELLTTGDISEVEKFIEQAILGSVKDQRYDEPSYRFLKELQSIIKGYLSDKNEFSEIVKEIICITAVTQRSHVEVLGRLNDFINRKPHFFKHYRLKELFGRLMMVGNQELPLNLFYCLLSSEFGIATLWRLIRTYPGIGFYHPRDLEARPQEFLRLIFQEIEKHFSTDGEQSDVIALLEVHGEISNQNTPRYTIIYSQTMLHIAVCYNNINAVAYILNSGTANCDALDIYDLTPLHYAVLRQNKVLVRLLIKGGANPNIQAMGQYSPLAIAVLLQDVDMVNFLVKEGGANLSILTNVSPAEMPTDVQHPLISISSVEGEIIFYPSSFDLAQIAMMQKKQLSLQCLIDLGVELVGLKNRPKEYKAVNCANNVSATLFNDDSILMIAAYFGDVDSIDWLLNYLQKYPQKRQELIDYVSPNTKYNALLIAIRKNHPQVLEYFDRNGIVNFQGLVQGMTVLHHAILLSKIMNKENIIEYVCQRYPELLNIVDNRGNAPLHCAAQRSNARAVSFLLAAEANVMCENKEGKTALQLIPSNQSNDNLVIRRSLTIRMNKLKENKLWQAAEQGDCEEINKLYQQRVNMNAQDEKQKFTALHFALYHEKTDAFTLLISYNVDITLCDINGLTVFLLAAYLHNVEALRQLHSMCEDLQACDNEKRNAIAAAKLNTKTDVNPTLRLLQEWGIPVETNVVMSVKPYNFFQSRVNDSQQMLSSVPEIQMTPF